MIRRLVPAPNLLAAGALLWASLAAAQPVFRLPAADRALAGRPAPAFVARADDMDVAAVAFDAADNLYVLDRAAPHVRVFDRTGRPVRRWGARGTAPGQLLAPVRVAVTTDGMVVVSDAGHRAFLVYRPDGTFVRSLRFAADRLAGLEMLPHPRGGVVADARPFSMQGRIDAGGPDSRLAVVWRPLDAGAAESTLYRAEVEVVRTGGDAGPRPGSQLVASGPPAFAPKLTWAPLPAGRLALSHSPRYAVRILGADGRVERVLERPFTPRAVTERDREAERERVRGALTRGQGGTLIAVGNRGPLRLPQSLIDAQVEGMEFADVVPVVGRVAADAQGRIWVRRSAAGGAEGPIDLLTPDGRYLGTLTGQALPDAFSPTGRAAYVETDAAGRTTVAVRTLPAWR